MKKLTILFLPFCFLLQLSAQTTHIVDDDGGGDFTTIAAAIAGVIAGDTISITGGADNTHTEQGINVNKSLNFKGQGQHITIVQAAATQAVATNRVFRFVGGNSASFRDFTIQNGNASSGSRRGAAISMQFTTNSSLTMKRMTLTNNKATGNGGALYLFGNEGIVTVEECVISNNSSNGGGGIINSGVDNLTIRNSSIIENTSGSGRGGGITIGEAGSTNRFINCTISSNTTTAFFATGGGIIIRQAQLTEFINCTIVENTTTGNSIEKGAGIDWSSGDLNLINTLVAQNIVKGPAVENIYANNASGTFTQTTSLVENCANGDGLCPTFTFTQANLAPASICGNHTFYEPLAGSEALDNATAPGSLNIPTEDICGNTRIAAHDIGSYDFLNVAPTAIPTLSEWAMIILALLMGVMATLALKARMRLVVGTHGDASGLETLGTNVSTSLPFDGRRFAKILAVVLGAVIAVFAIAIIAFGYELTSADVPGTLIAAPVAAYLIHLWRK